MFFLIVFLTVVLLVGSWYLVQVAMYLLARLGIFWTIMTEGYAVAIMRNGKFHRMLLAYTGHHFARYLPGDAPEDVDNLNIYEVVPAPNAEATPTPGSRVFDFLFPVKGLAWIGWPRFDTVYHFVHKWVDDKEGPRAEPMDKILVQEYVYALRMKNIELEGGIPYTILLLVTGQVTNPAKALFRVGRYVDTSMERVHGWARTEFSSLSFDDFVAKTTGLPGELSGATPAGRLDAAIARIMSSATELSHEFGFTVRKIQVAEIDPADESLRAITLKKEIAKQEGEAAIEKARLEAQAAKEEAAGKASVIETLATAEATAMEKMNGAAEKLGSNALRLKELDAVKNAHLTIIGRDVSIPTVVTVPSQQGG